MDMENSYVSMNYDNILCQVSSKVQKIGHTITVSRRICGGPFDGCSREYTTDLLQERSGYAAHTSSGDNDNNNKVASSTNLCYYNPNRESMGELPMSLVALYTYERGAFLISDTRSTKRYLSSGEVTYKDGFRKLHKVTDNLCFSITGSDTILLNWNYPDMTVAEYLLKKNPKTEQELWERIFDLEREGIVSDEMKPVITIYSFTQKDVHTKYIERVGDAYQATMRLRPYTYDSHGKNPYLAQGSQHAFSYLDDAGLAFRNYKDGIKQLTEAFETIENISSQYPISYVGGGLDILHYDSQTGKLEEIRRDSKPL